MRQIHGILFREETGAAGLLDLYLPLAERDVSTREGFEGYVRRIIRPGLGHLKVRKEVHGPVLDTCYARLKKCGDLTCSGKLFTEQHNVPACGRSLTDTAKRWKWIDENLAESAKPPTVTTVKRPATSQRKSTAAARRR